MKKNICPPEVLVSESCPRTTVYEFVNKWKPFADQFKDGTPIVKPKKVAEFVIDLPYILINAANKITVCNGVIIVGIHRWAACKKALENGTIDPNFSFPIIIEFRNETFSETCERAYRSNFQENNNSRNHAIGGGMNVSKYLIAPMMESVVQACPAFKKGRSMAQKLSQRLAAIFYRNPALQVQLLAVPSGGQHLAVNAVDIYNARRDDLSSAKFVNVNKEVVAGDSLRPLINPLSILLNPALNLIQSMRDNGDWSRYGLNTAMEYIIIELGLQGLLARPEATKLLYKRIKARAGEIHPHMNTFAHEPKVSRDLILLKLGVSDLKLKKLPRA